VTGKILFFAPQHSAQMGFNDYWQYSCGVRFFARVRELTAGHPMLEQLGEANTEAEDSRHPSSRVSLSRYGGRAGLHNTLFETSSAFTHVAACTRALLPLRDTLIGGFSHFVSSMTAPIASGWNGCRVEVSPTGKRRLATAYANEGMLKPAICLPQQDFGFAACF